MLLHNEATAALVKIILGAQICRRALFFVCWFVFSQIKVKHRCELINKTSNKYSHDDNT